MSTPDGRFTIVFNGEIYNFEEVRARLEKQGVCFRSKSDTEVVLRAYETYGAECLDKFIGMFSFGVWDSVEKSCFLARDQFGIKPLYFLVGESLLLFASELRAVLASGLVQRKLSWPGAYGFFLTGSVPEPSTLIEGVQMLEAGHWMRWKAEKIVSKHWCSTSLKPPEPPTLDYELARSEVRAVLLDSVRRHFISDVPVGVFLSGGIDSSAILALAVAAGRSRDLHTFSIAFDDQRFNEGELAARTSRHFSSRHFECMLDSLAGKRLLEDFLPYLDQPTIDGFNTFAVAKLAHQHGLKVVLSGLGGDELFGGYPTFRNLPRLLRLSRALAGFPGLRSFAAHMLANNSRPKLRRLSGFLGEAASPLTAFRTLRGVFSTSEAANLANSYAGLQGSVPADPTDTKLSYQSTSLNTVSELELGLYMRNQLLRDSDVMSMAWGLELRVPFVDRVVLDVLSKIPPGIRFRRGKELLVKSVPEIPEWIWNRSKRGFHFPMESWLSADLSLGVDQECLGSVVRAQTWYQKWGLFVFRRWCDTNGVLLHAS